MERKPYIWSDLFKGNWEIFRDAVRNPETVIVYDIDGILANSAEKVLQRFSDENGIAADPIKINGWGYLTDLAKAAGLPQEKVNHAEDFWYDPQLLLTVRRHLYIKPVVLKTIHLYGSERNYVLTSRNPQFKDLTLKWFAREFPEIPFENILIRNSKNIDSADFKAKCLGRLAETAPWVVFIDDAPDFIKSALDLKINNLVAVNIPQGMVAPPDFRNDRLVVIKRYPENLQAMYPLLDALERVAQS